jgi:hypothetical protein
MKKVALNLLAGLSVLSLCAGGSFAAETAKMPEMPKPGPEQDWLQQFVGQWSSENEAYLEPGKEPVHSKGTETVKPVGGFWTVSDVKGTMFNQPFNGQMTLGFDAEKKKYVGTWVDSMTGKQWSYEGVRDGNALTLEAEGACPMKPGKVTKFKEVIELKDKNHKVFTSNMLGEDGKWIPTMTSKATRVNVK